MAADCDINGKFHRDEFVSGAPVWTRPVAVIIGPVPVASNFRPQLDASAPITFKPGHAAPPPRPQARQPSRFNFRRSLRRI